MIAAIISLFTGLQLESIVQKNRQDFEMRLLELAEIKKEDLGEKDE